RSPQPALATRRREAGPATREEPTLANESGPRRRQDRRTRRGTTDMNWNDRRILVTGGASFISSHLIDLLVSKGARTIRVVDDLSSGKRENIERHIEAGIVEFRQQDLLAPGVAQQAVEGIDVVFHLAAIHGGRGFVDLH